MADTFTAPDGYARKTKAGRPMLTVRYLTLAEIQALPTNGHAQILANDGCVRNVKITSVHLWKTRPQDVHVGVKYGMYEYAQFDAPEALRRFVTVV